MRPFTQVSMRKTATHVLKSCNCVFVPLCVTQVHWQVRVVTFHDWTKCLFDNWLDVIFKYWSSTTLLCLRLILFLNLSYSSTCMLMGVFVFHVWNVLSPRDCMGVVDCQWCQLHKDGKTPMSAPYCASQRVCFGGVVGAHSPYGDEISGRFTFN